MKMKRYEIIVNKECFEVSAPNPWIAADKGVKRYCEAHPMTAVRKRKSGYSILMQMKRIG